MVRQSGKDIGKPGLRIDLVQFAGFDQDIDRGRALPATVRAGEGPVAPTNRDEAFIAPLFLKCL
jgi:hypothetical protein